MKKIVSIFICFSILCLLFACSSAPAEQGTASLSVSPAPSASMQSSGPDSSVTPSAQDTKMEETQPAETKNSASTADSKELYSSYAHMVSFDPDSGLAEFDYFDILRGEDAVNWLVVQEEYSLADAQEEVSNYADSEFIEKNTNPQLRTIDLKKTALQLIVRPDGALNEGAESSEVGIGEYCALYETDPSLLLDLYFYYIEVEGGKAISVGQVYWP